MTCSSGLFAADAAASFKQRCAPCHGADAKGNTTIGKSLNIPDLTSATVSNAKDAELTQVISEGHGSMPAFKGTLSSAEIKQMVLYIRSLHKTPNK
jgi:mono/diheme cytochrome c family protein